MKAPPMLIPQIFAVPLAKPMMYYPAAAVKLWEEKAEEQNLVFSGGRFLIKSYMLGGERKYYISGYAVRKKVYVGNRP